MELSVSQTHLCMLINMITPCLSVSLFFQSLVSLLVSLVVSLPPGLALELADATLQPGATDSISTVRQVLLATTQFGLILNFFLYPASAKVDNDKATPLLHTLPARTLAEGRGTVNATLSGRSLRDSSTLCAAMG